MPWLSGSPISSTSVPRSAGAEPTGRFRPTWVRRASSGGIPIGFDDDAAYLGTLEQFALERLLIVPSIVSPLTDMETFRYLHALLSAASGRPDARLRLEPDVSAGPACSFGALDGVLMPRLARRARSGRRRAAAARRSRCD